ncbi:MAG: hypothetical protein WDA25_09905 [Paracoccaceae bacterium]
MSNTDSFIDEVTQEVQRDRLFALMRRYGWIGIVAILALVGYASWSEWEKSRQAAQAQALGDSILAALAVEDNPGPALAAIEADGEAGAIVALLAAANGGDEAAAQLGAMANDPALRPIYRDLAALRAVMLSADTTAPDDRIAALTPLARPGAPYRVLAEEQIALAEIEAGRQTDAVARLTRISEDNEAGVALQRRVAQLLVALDDVAQGAEPAGNSQN